MADGGTVSRVSGPWVNALVAACGLAAAGRLLWMIDGYAVNVLFWDQFSFYEALIGDPSGWELFRWQHGPHRQGLPFLLTAALAQATDWNSRADSFLVGGAVCAAAGLALWLRRRVFGPLHPADVAIPLLVLTPAQYAIFVHTPNLSHGAGPLVLLLAFCLAFAIPGRAVRYAVLVALDFLLVHSGFGLIAGALAPPLFLLCALAEARAHGVRAALAPATAAALALANVAIFAIGYDTHDLDQVVAGVPPHGYPAYVALAFANLLGVKQGVFALVAGGAATLAVLCVAVEQVVRLLRGERSPERALAILTLTSFALLFSAVAAYGRISLGFAGAQASRYVPLLVPGLLGVYLRLTEIGAARWRTALLTASAVVVVLATFPMRESEARYMEQLSRGKRAWVEAYLANGSLEGANAIARQPIFPYEAREVRRLLAYMREHRLNFYAGR